MTEQERIELLRDVARVAPKEMKPHKWHESVSDGTCNSVRFESLYDARLSLKSDGDDARGIIAMLDAMEERGLAWELYTRVYYEYDNSGINGYECTAYSPDDPDMAYEWKGETRAEAVARAFIEVFEQLAEVSL